MLRNILPNTMSDTLRRPLVNIRLLGTTVAKAASALD